MPSSVGSASDRFTTRGEAISKAWKVPATLQRLVIEALPLQELVTDYNSSATSIAKMVDKYIPLHPGTMVTVYKATPCTLASGTVRTPTVPSGHEYSLQTAHL